MGAAGSRAEPTSFAAVWAELPEEARDRIAALADKESDVLLKPNPAAPSPTKLPLGTSSMLDHSAATAALAIVPRLQRKHYELIPKVLDEMSFWTSFFSHVTVIVAEAAPQLLPAPGEGDGWKVSLPDDSFSAAWAAATLEARDALAALAARDSDALLSPAPGAPPPFPSSPLCLTVGISEAAATAALTVLPTLQRKHYALVPKRIDEKRFWVHFFSHATVLLTPA